MMKVVKNSSAAASPDAKRAKAPPAGDRPAGAGEKVSLHPSTADLADWTHASQTPPAPAGPASLLAPKVAKKGAASFKQHPAPAPHSAAGQFAPHMSIPEAADAIDLLVQECKEAKRVALKGQVPPRSVTYLFGAAKKIVRPFLSAQKGAKDQLPGAPLIAFKHLAYEANLGGQALKFLGVNAANTSRFPPASLPHLAELARKDAGIKIAFPNLAESLCDAALRACRDDPHDEALEAVFGHAWTVKVAVLKDGTKNQRAEFLALPLFPQELPIKSPQFYRYLVTLALGGRYTAAADRAVVRAHLTERLAGGPQGLTIKGREDTLAALEQLKI